MLVLSQDLGTRVKKRGAPHRRLKINQTTRLKFLIPTY